MDSVDRLVVWTPGAVPADLASRDIGFSSHGILDASGFSAPEVPRSVAVTLPPGSVGVTGSYEAVMADIKRRRGDIAEVALIVARRNEPEFEEFLSGIAELSIAHHYAGGVAAYPAGATEGDLFPDVDVAIVLTYGRTTTHSIHDPVGNDVNIDFAGRELLAIEGSDPVVYLRNAASGLVDEFDLEHVTIGDADGRNVHLVNRDGIVTAGATFNGRGARLRVVSSVSDGLDSVLRDKTTVSFSCAGLGGAIERPLAPSSGIVAWMFGEVIDVGNGPQLGNLMISRWKE